MQRAVWPISHFGPFVMYFFGVRELAPAFSTADSSAVCLTPRPVVAYKSGDESPHSKRRVRITALRSATTSNLRRRMVPDFGVRELAPALSTADSSAVGVAPRRVAASKSGDEPPHSKSFARANSLCGSRDTVLSRNARTREAEASPFRANVHLDLRSPFRNNPCRKEPLQAVAFP